MCWTLAYCAGRPWVLASTPEGVALSLPLRLQQTDLVRPRRRSPALLLRAVVRYGSTPTPFPHRWAPSGTRAGTGEMVQGSKSLMCFCGSLGHTRRRACPPETRSPLGVLPPPPALWGPFPLSSDSLSPLGLTVSAATKCRDGPPRGSKWESKEENQPPTLPRFRS